MQTTIPDSASSPTLVLSVYVYAIELVPCCLLVDLLGKSAVNPPLPLCSNHSTPLPRSSTAAYDPAWPPLDVSQKCENKMALDLLTHRAECDCRRRGGGGVGSRGGGSTETTLFSSTHCYCAPALARGTEEGDVEEVCRQLELSESKVGRHFDWPDRGMLTLESSPGWSMD